MSDPKDLAGRFRDALDCDFSISVFMKCPGRSLMRFSINAYSPIEVN